MIDVLLEMLIKEYMGDIETIRYLGTSWHWLWLGPYWYCVFFCAKWALMTFPIWFPIRLICDAISSVFKSR